jgi:hypothetical protein
MMLAKISESDKPVSVQYSNAKMVMNVIENVIGTSQIKARQAHWPDDRQSQPGD